jgi:DNA-binding HxlR family transcriptional regulator
VAGLRADGDVVVRADHDPDHHDLRHCELVLNLLSRKWVIPVLGELAGEPRRRKYLFHTLKVSSSRLDPTIQELTRLGLIERTFIPSGRTDGPGLAITELGRSFLLLVTTLGEWEHLHRTELLTNVTRWRDLHPDQAV